jgi:hypothetical protein
MDSAFCRSQEKHNSLVVIVIDDMGYILRVSAS